MSNLKSPSSRFVHLNWGSLVVLALVGLSLVGSTGCQMASQGQNIEGVRLFQQGQYQAAMGRFQHAASTDPYNADAYYNLAAAYHRMGKETSNDAALKQAEDLYHQCLNLSPNHADCYRGLAVLLVDTGRSDKAFTLLQRWVQRSPEIADARVELARLYEEYRDKETAQMHLHDAIAIDPTHSRAWAALGKMREESGELKQALANYERSYRLNNFQGAVANRIASLQRKTSGSFTAPTDTRIVTGPVASHRY